MRAAEFIVEYKDHFNGIDLSLEVQKDNEYVDDEDTENQVVFVKATANGKDLGYVIFTIEQDSQGQYLYPQDLEVEERFRGQGIAKTMYDYVKSKGYRIRRSGQQTDAGAGFWAKHRPEQNIWEAFDQPYPLTWERAEHGMDAFTKLPDGTPLEINFNDEYDHEGNEITQVDFHRSHSQSVTGEGDAQRIFATVLSAIQQFINDERPKRITFAADKEPGPSRANLYTKLVQRFAAPLGYQVDTYEAGTSLHFDLTRRWGLRR